MTQHDLRELESLLEDDHQIEHYIRLMSLESMLHASFSTEEQGTAEASSQPHHTQTSIENPKPPIPFTRPSLAQTSINPNKNSWVWGGLAASIVIGIAGYGLVHLDQSSRPSVNEQKPIAIDGKNIARISGSIGLNAIEKNIFKTGSYLNEKKFTLETGLLEITTPNGSRLMIEAPADLSINHPNHISLNSGKVSVFSPGSNKNINVSCADLFVVRGADAFAIFLPHGSSTPPEISALQGSLQIESVEHRGKPVLTLPTNESVQYLPDGTLENIPYQGGRFFEKLPAHDPLWSISYDSSEKNTIEIDVSGLVWRPGKYRAVFKWLSGKDAMTIDKLQLYHHGHLVSEDIHPGITGKHHITKNHLYDLYIPSSGFQTDQWKLIAHVAGVKRPNKSTPEHSQGILYSDHQSSLKAAREDFVGSWEYTHQGKKFTRKLDADGSLEIFGGVPNNTGRWWIKDDIVFVTMDRNSLTELHMLRDKKTLLFIDQPYQPALKKQKDAPENSQSSPLYH